MGTVWEMAAVDDWSMEAIGAAGAKVADATRSAAVEAAAGVTAAAADVLAAQVAPAAAVPGCAAGSAPLCPQVATTGEGWGVWVPSECCN